MKIKRIKSSLVSQEIDRLSDEIGNFCKDSKMDSKEIIRLKLSMEEVLLRWQRIFGTEQTVQLSIRTGFGKLHLSLVTAGDSHNPLDTSLENDDDVMIRRLMDNLTLSLQYSYQNGINRITCDRQIKADNRFFTSLIIAIVAGILCGFAGRLLPAGTAEAVMGVLNLISTVIMGLIKMAAMPVIFLCTIKGILSTGGLSAFGSSGKKTILGYLLTMLYLLIFSILVSMVFFIGSSASTAVSSGSFFKVFEVLFSLFPDNIFSPFLSGDNVKILFLAVLCGCALLFIGPRADRLNDALSVLADMSTAIMNWVCKPMPVVIFILMVQNIWNIDTIKECATLWKLVLLIIGVYAAAILVEAAIAAKKKKLRFGTILKCISPVVLKGTATCSSMFCYTDMENILTEKLKAGKDFVNFSLPLGLTFFQPNLILLSSITMYFASISGQPLTLVWLLTLSIPCYISSFASTPVNGGLVALLAMVFASIGINDVYLGIASSLIMLLDYPTTGGRVALIMLEIMRLSPEEPSKEKETV